MFDCLVTIWSSLLYDCGINSCGISDWVISPYLLILTYLEILLDPILNRGVSKPLHTRGVHIDETRLLVGWTYAGVEKFFPDQTDNSLQHFLSSWRIFTSTGLHLHKMTASPATCDTRVLPFLSCKISKFALRRACDIMISVLAIWHARSFMFWYSRSIASSMLFIAPRSSDSNRISSSMSATSGISISRVSFGAEWWHCTFVVWIDVLFVSIKECI